MSKKGNNAEIAQSLRDSINKTFKDGVAYRMDKSTPSTVKGYISTGSTLLDVAISNRKDGGVPTGRLTEISGVESIGKSLMAYHLIANVQKKGGIAVLIDTENAASLEFMKRLGVNVEELIYMQLGTIEESFKAMESTIAKVRDNTLDKEKDLLIVWDSVAATSAEEEISGGYGDKTIGLAARLIGQGLRKIIPYIGKFNVTLVFINQLRTKIGVMYGDPMVTPGGKAIPFHSSVRVRLHKEADIKDSSKAIRGVRVKAKVQKNKVAPPRREASFIIRFGYGIQDVDSWLDPLINMGIVDQKGGWYNYGDIKFQRVNWAKIVKKHGLEDSLKEALYDKMVLKLDEDGDLTEVSDE